MLIPAFKLNMGNEIMQGQVSVGYFDGKHPSLTCATSAGKVFIHSPHDRSHGPPARVEGGLSKSSVFSRK